MREQRADGSWGWSDAALAYLGLGRAGCEPVFAELEDQWRLLADKALAWLAGQGVTPPAGSPSLEDRMAVRLLSVG